MSRLRTSSALAAGLAIFVGGFEGTRQTAYQDVGRVWTICSGHTDGVRPGDTKTLGECRKILADDLEIYADGVEKCTRADLPDARYVAFVSFAFNLGVHTYCSRIAPLVNAGHIREACNRLLLYNTVAGVPFPGLTNRRNIERTYCLYQYSGTA